jgi:hypothetical protein
VLEVGFFGGFGQFSVADTERSDLVRGSDAEHRDSEQIVDLHPYL